jgi:hypothetical protein
MSRKISLKEKLTARIKKVGTILLATLLMMLLMTVFCYLMVQLIPQDFSYELLHGRSDEKLFKVFLLDPIPKSVTILESQDDRGFGDYILLHFKISPDDFNSILASEKYKISDLGPSISGYYTDTENPEITWWNLRSLGKNATNYYVSIEYDGHQRYQNIWVNKQKNEVYFEVTFIY